MRRFLPSFYVEGFADLGDYIDGSPAVWVHRTAIGLHATWKRRGELWRRATEDVLLEVNARTLLRARRFVLAPKPAIPG